MKYLLPGLTLLGVLYLVILLLYPAPAKREMDTEWLTVTLPVAPKAGGEDTKKPAVYRFHVELARQPEEQAKGLMYRHALADDAGMLFVFPAPKEASFWMKHTLIPLDMLFIAPDWRVHRIEENTEPNSLTPIASDGPVIAVLELKAGTAARLGIGPGARVHREAE